MTSTQREATTSAMTSYLTSAASAASASGPTSASASAAAHGDGQPAGVKAIDFRVRPPFRSFGHAANRSGGDPDEERLMDQFLQRMSEAGIEMAVVMGRTAPAPGPFRQFVANADIAALLERYPGTFFGFGSIDAREPQRAVEEVARCAGLGLKGIAFDNMLGDPPLHNDDASLMPIYEACARHGLIIAINASGAMGPDMSYSDPVHIQKVAQAFPTHPVVVTHGAWPYAREMVALALYGLLLRNANVYFQIDYALMGDVPLPGASDYIDAVNLTGVGEGVDLYRKALFGSSYPAIDMKLASERFARLDFRIPGAREAIMRDNATALLGIE